MKKNEKQAWESPYWHPAVTTDAVVFGFDGKDLNILLIERGNDPFKGSWALPGGFMIEDDQNALAGVIRELGEETNAKDVPLKEIGTFSEKDRDPRERVITIAFSALVKKDVFEIRADTDAKRAEWFKINELPRLAFDHKAIIDKAMENLRKSILFEPVGFDLLNEEFTLPQLQNIYLAILNPERDNKKLCDRRNFKKKMDSLGYIEQIQGKTFKETGRKPSNLYRFNKEAYQAAKSRGIHLEFYN